MLICLLIIQERQERDQTLQTELSAAQEEAEELRQGKWELERRLTEDTQRWETQLQEKREQVLLAKGEVDRVTLELAEERQISHGLRTQRDTALVGGLLPSQLCQVTANFLSHRHSCGRRRLS